ncbi:hypothetical protein RFI_34609, partial [Reticulomyxa filosa]
KKKKKRKNFKTSMEMYYWGIGGTKCDGHVQYLSECLRPHLIRSGLGGYYSNTNGSYITMDSNQFSQHWHYWMNSNLLKQQQPRNLWDMLNLPRPFASLATVVEPSAKVTMMAWINVLIYHCCRYPFLSSDFINAFHQTNFIESTLCELMSLFKGFWNDNAISKMIHSQAMPESLFQKYFDNPELLLQYQLWKSNQMEMKSNLPIGSTDLMVPFEHGFYCYPVLYNTANSTQVISFFFFFFFFFFFLVLLKKCIFVCRLPYMPMKEHNSEGFEKLQQICKFLKRYQGHHIALAIFYGIGLTSPSDNYEATFSSALPWCIILRFQTPPSPVLLPHPSSFSFVAPLMPPLESSDDGKESETNSITTRRLKKFIFIFLFCLCVYPSKRPSLFFARANTESSKLPQATRLQRCRTVPTYQMVSTLPMTPVLQIPRHPPCLLSLSLPLPLTLLGLFLKQANNDNNNNKSEIKCDIWISDQIK